MESLTACSVAVAWQSIFFFNLRHAWQSDIQMDGFRRLQHHGTWRACVEAQPNACGRRASRRGGTRTWTRSASKIYYYEYSTAGTWLVPGGVHVHPNGSFSAVQNQSYRATSTKSSSARSQSRTLASTCRLQSCMHGGDETSLGSSICSAGKVGASLSEE